MGHFSVWTDEQSEALTSLVDSGHSFSLAAIVLNNRFGTSFTRDAAIGRIFRMKKKGLPPPAADIQHIRRTLNTIKPRQAPKPPSPKPLAPRPVERTIRCDPVEPLHLTLLDLDKDHCRWPYSESPNITFCGHSKMIGSYCLAHFVLSVGAGTAAERAAA